MFCTNCGKKALDDAVFCEYCGARLEIPEVDWDDGSVVEEAIAPLVSVQEPHAPVVNAVTAAPDVAVPLTAVPVPDVTMPLTAPAVPAAADFTMPANGPVMPEAEEPAGEEPLDAGEKKAGTSRNLKIAGIAAAALLAVGIAAVAFSGGFRASAPGEPGFSDAPPAQPTAVPEKRDADEPAETPDPEPVPLVWSEPMEALPAGISAENSAIRPVLRYQSTPLYRQVNNKSAPDGCRLFEDYRYGAYRVLSDYTGNWVNGSASANDWTQTRRKTTTSGGGGGAWSSWTNYGYWYNGSACPTPPVSGGERYEIRYGAQTPQGATPCEYRVWRQQPAETTTVDQYETRQVEYTFYNDSAWSGWSDAPIPQNGETLVRCQTFYCVAPLDGGWTAHPSMENFPSFEADYAGMFRDVDDNAWYGANQKNVLRTVCELNVLLPDGFMNFKPDGEVTVGQAIRAAVIVSRVYNGYEGGLIGENDGNDQPYADYAVRTGMLADGDFPDLARSVTREELAYILYRALPESEYAATREAAAVSDMGAGRYYDCVLTLAKAGVVNLNDGAYRPGDAAKRAEAAGLIDALIYPAHRGA